MSELRPGNYGPRPRPWVGPWEGEAAYWAGLYSSAGLPLVPVCWPGSARQCAWHTRQYRVPVLEDAVRCRCGKTPMFQHYVNEPLMARAPVEEFWRSQPLAGPAVALWSAALVRLDVDGPAALVEAVRRGLPEPLIMVQSTRPEGGWHIYWRRQGGLPLAITAEVLPDGSRIEIDSDGFAPLPPAVRPPWSWLQWIGPALGEVEPPPTPEWAVDLLHRTAERKAARVEARPVPATVASGTDAPSRPRKDLSVRMQALLDLGPQATMPGRYPTRTEALFALECAMARARWTLGEAEAALLGAPWIAATVQEHGGVGWLQADLARAFAWAWQPKSTTSSTNHNDLWGVP